MYQHELEIALGAAERAGEYLCGEYRQFQAIPDAPASITTHADRQSQEIILQHILKHFPNDSLCAEEATPSLEKAPSAGERLWIVDPIDGTRGFAQKNGEFSVMVAFVKGGQIAVGVVLEPARKRLTYAIQGQGCWRRDGEETIPCRVTDMPELAQATMIKSRSRVTGSRSRWVELLHPARVIESHSAGIKLAMVARGEGDYYLMTYDAVHDWDLCAGHLLVTEAGGIVTGTAGQELSYGLPGAWQRQGLLATNGRLHEKALEKIGKS